MKNHLLLLLIFSYSILNSQNLDSLKAELQNSPSDKNTISVLFELAKQDSKIENKKGYHKKILSLAKGDLAKHAGEASLRLGMNYHNSKGKDSAIYYYNKAIELLNPNTEGLSFGSLYNNLSLLSRENMDTSLFYAKKSLEYRERSGDSLEMAFSYQLLGDVYDEKGIYFMSLKFYLKAIEIYKNQENFGGLIIIYNNLGLVYGKLNDYKNKLILCQKTVETIIKSGDSTRYNGAMNNLANVYKELGEFDKALEIHQNVLKRRKINETYGKGESFYNMAEVYFEKGDIQKALQFALKSHDLFIEAKVPYAQMYSTTILGRIYMKLKEYKLASNYLNDAEKFAKGFGLPPETLGIYEALASLYELKGDFKTALKYSHLYLEMRDTLKSIEDSRLTKEMAVKFDTQLQGLKIINLEFEKDLKDSELKNEKIKSKEQNRLIWFIGVGLILAIIAIILAVRGFIQKKKSNEIITIQKMEVEEKNQEIMDSISYAKRIQTAILPPDSLFKEYLPNSFVLYKPKDIVAGDFYWMSIVQGESGNRMNSVSATTMASSPPERTEERILFAAADCTGHGVPGAMVSVLCNGALNRAVGEFGLIDPGEILDKTREIVIQEFAKSDEEVKDGMDISLCLLMKTPDGKKTIKYAGANNALWLINPSRKTWPTCFTLFKQSSVGAEIKADKQPIGKFRSAKPFTTHSFEIEKGDTIYLFTDGYADQFGKNELVEKKAGKKFKSANFKKLLLSVNDLPLHEQEKHIFDTFTKWKGDLEQIDDVCVIGVRL